MPYYELVEGGVTIAAFNYLHKAREAYVKVANKRLHQKFKDYATAHSFIFEAGLEDDLYIIQPELPDEDEVLGSII